MAKEKCPICNTELVYDNFLRRSVCECDRIIDISYSEKKSEIKCNICNDTGYIDTFAGSMPCDCILSQY